MNQFNGLIQNESMKIFKKTGTKVMFLILAALIVIVGLFMRFLVEQPQANEEYWNDHLKAETMVIEERLLEPNLSPIEKEQLEKQKLVNNYHLENEIEPLSNNGFWQFLISNGQLVHFITMFTVIVAAGIVATEHATGTIKLLLIRPVQRWKVLLSKWVSVMYFSLTMLLALLFISIIVGIVMYPTDLSGARWVEFVGGEIRDWHVVQYVFTIYGLNFVELIMMTTFAFMIGTVFRNQSLAIGLSLVLLFTGGQVVFLLSQYEWMKYVLFANTYFMQYIEQSPLIEGMTPVFSILMLTIYFAIFLFVSIVTFTLRDVAE
ncbi:ABC transporter permease [Bacillus shivajii]|uniref:ABC transporter permease subunit n=1 Tax=Bacillus shivajii TaxID=1983719 RepID=UPI001CF9EAAB|nr:ABC transporter permease subunit [Bacillus shivajii]UCZ51565.1 ABC transporter permease [Bacillus shivajii]